MELSRVKELERIKKVYAKRESLGKDRFYTRFSPSGLFESQQRERSIIDAIKRNYNTELSDMKILDVGCGSGVSLRNFIRYGASPENMHGIDLLPEKIEIAKKLSPNIDFKCGDASNLPYEDESFDIVIQFVVFTSILGKDMKKKIASEMLRVNKSKGIILWIDFHVNNPKNPDVKGVRKKEIYELFPDCDIYLKRVNLAPPLIRLIAPYSWLVCYLLEKLKIFNTHYIGVIWKRDDR